jgi:hypothetical protein
MIADTYGMALKEIIPTVAERDAEYEELQAPAKELVFREDSLACGGREFGLGQNTRDELFGNLHAPVSYWRKHSPRFQGLALLEHAKRGDLGDRPTLVVRQGILITILGSQLMRLPNATVLTAAQEALGREGESLSVARLDMRAGLMEVELVSPLKTIDVRVGDYVMGGIHIRHGWHSNQPTQVQSFVLRLECKNGMTRRVCTGDGIARTRKLPVDYPNARELQQEQIGQLTVQHWNGLQRQLEALRETSGRRANVQEVLTRFLQKARISPDLMPRLLAAWEREGAENSIYGAVNALTRVATHDGSLGWRQRRMLASVGGLLAFSDVHLCDRCWSLLSSSAGDVASAA